MYQIIIKCYLLFVSMFLFYKEKHLSRNIHNIMPVGYLQQTNYPDNYIDSNSVIWIRRPFMKSLFHQPWTYHVYETYDRDIVNSSEII